jgi:hypothetical protein
MLSTKQEAGSKTQNCSSARAGEIVGQFKIIEYFELKLVSHLTVNLLYSYLLKFNNNKEVTSITYYYIQ